MSRSWPYLTSVAVVGVLAGAAIGGKPVAQDPFVLSPEQIPATTVVASAPTVSGSTGSSVATSNVSTATPETPSVATTIATSTDTVPATVRVLLADATGTPNALSTAKTKLDASGYTRISTTSMSSAEASSTIYYRAGFVVDAAAASALLGVAQAPLVLLTDQVVTPIDAEGDVVVLLGSDVQP